MLLKLTTINLGFVLLLLITACSSNNPFVSRWEAVELEGEWIEFSKENTFEINSFSNMKVIGTYVYRGNIATLTPTNLEAMNGEPISASNNSFTATLNDDILNVSFSSDNQGSYRKVKPK